MLHPTVWFPPKFNPRLCSTTKATINVCSFLVFGCPCKQHLVQLCLIVYIFVTCSHLGVIVEISCLHRCKGYKNISFLV